MPSIAQRWQRRCRVPLELSAREDKQRGRVQYGASRRGTPSRLHSPMTSGGQAAEVGASTYEAAELAGLLVVGESFVSHTEAAPSSPVAKTVSDQGLGADCLRPPSGLLNVWQSPGPLTST